MTKCIAAGACLGMSTFGPHGQFIAVLTATIERIVPLLLKDGRITLYTKRLERGRFVWPTGSNHRPCSP